MFSPRASSLGLVRSTNDFGEKRQDKTETLKTQIASVALSALKSRDSSRDSKDNNGADKILTTTTSTSLSSTAAGAAAFQQPPTETPKQHRGRKNPPNRLQLAPPPIPKRTFQGRIYAGSETRLPKVQSKSLSDADNSKLDCASDLCSISFDDIGDSDDLVIFDKKLDPNQSSSDSSRSQTTIDTGYISAFEDRSSVSTNQRQFRGRFSSEDTQSSLDSYLSSDLQRADTIDSLHSNFTDSPFILKKNSNVFNFDQTRLSKKISSSGSIDSDNNNINNKSISTPIKSNANTALRSGRPMVSASRKGIRPPPIPPLRATQLVDISTYRFLSS